MASDGGEQKGGGKAESTAGLKASEVIAVFFQLVVRRGEHRCQLRSTRVRLGKARCKMFQLKLFKVLFDALSPG